MKSLANFTVYKINGIEHVPGICNGNFILSQWDNKYLHFSSAFHHFAKSLCAKSIPRGDFNTQPTNNDHPPLHNSKTHLASRKISFMSMLARNINMFWCSLISVIAEGGSEWPTATRPRFWTQLCVSPYPLSTWKTRAFKYPEQWITCKKVSEIIVMDGTFNGCGNVSNANLSSAESLFCNFVSFTIFLFASWHYS